MNTHQCYIQKKELPAPNHDYIFFDIEAMQETGVHEANLVVAQYRNGEQYNFPDIHAFCKWLIQKKHKGYTAVSYTHLTLPTIYSV